MFASNNESNSRGDVQLNYSQHVPTFQQPQATILASDCKQTSRRVWWPHCGASVWWARSPAMNKQQTALHFLNFRCKCHRITLIALFNSICELEHRAIEQKLFRTFFLRGTTTQKRVCTLNKRSGKCSSPNSWVRALLNHWLRKGKPHYFSALRFSVPFHEPSHYFMSIADCFRLSARFLVQLFASFTLMLIHNNEDGRRKVGQSSERR